MSARRSRECSKVKWSKSDLELAFRRVRDGTSIRKAARDYGIPFSTLQERLKTENTKFPSLGRNTIFTKEQEREMADQIRLLGKVFYGCTALKIRQTAFEYAEKNNIPNNFNREFGTAGRDWLKGFLLRNKLSVRKAEGTSLNRATAFNRDEVSLFFRLLENVMDNYKFLPRNIYNVDETGISSVQDPGKVVAQRGQKRVGSITSGERGKTITAVCAMSATGVYVPPMLIYARQRHSIALEANGPRGAVYRCSKNGWITEDLFVDWLKHFAEITKPSQNDRILLILDNHASHISLKAYEFCKSNNIVMLSLPPHGSHRIQPMDITIYGPLKTAYKQECNLFMKSNLGRQIAQTDIASIFRKAFQKVATISKAEAGFAAAGIFPLNPDIFTDEDFLAAEYLNNATGLIEAGVCELDNRRPDSAIVPAASTRNDSVIVSAAELTPDVLEIVATALHPGSPVSRDSPSLLDSIHIEATEVILNSETGLFEAVVQERGNKTPDSQIVYEAESHPGLVLNQTFNMADLSQNAIGNNKLNLSTSSSAMTSLIDYNNPVPSCSTLVSAKDLLPIPKKCADNKSTRRSRKQHAIVITGTPFKDILVQKENRRLKKVKTNVPKTKKIHKTETKSHRKRQIKVEVENKAVKMKKVNTNDVRKAKRKILQDAYTNDSESTSNSEIEMVDLRDDGDTDVEEESSLCVICCDTGRDGELWYRCVLCALWAHAECTGLDSPRDYKCDLCLDRS